MASSATNQIARDVQLKPVATAPEHTFRASHFFVLASLMAATAAVVVSRQSTPEHLVLVSLTIGAAGLSAAGLYRMLSPLVAADAAPAADPLSGRARQVLEREKLLTMRALKDLEFDRSMGRMSPADFDEMAARLRARAMSLMKQLDDDGSGYRSLIERELRERVAAPAPAVAAAAAPETAADGVCACGTANDADAMFCKRCGSRLGTSSPASAQ
jgi:hypothetical protein